MMYTFNLNSGECQLYFNKTGRDIRDLLSACWKHRLGLDPVSVSLKASKSNPSDPSCLHLATFFNYWPARMVPEMNTKS